MEPEEARSLRAGERIQLIPPPFRWRRYTTHARVSTVRAVGGTEAEPIVETEEGLEFRASQVERAGDER